MIRLGKPKVDRSKDQRGHAQRLRSPHEELARLGRDPEVIHVDEVETRLTDHRDQQGLSEKDSVDKQARRICSQPDLRGDRYDEQYRDPLEAH